MKALGRYGPAALLAALIGVAFGRLLLRVDWTVGDDVLEFAGPLSTFFLRSIASGDSPVWNPYAESGASIFCWAPWMGPFYPLVVLFRLLPLGWALNAGYLAHIAIAALGCWLFARALSLGRAGATVAAAVLVLSSELVYRVNQGYLPDTVSVAWLPWLLWCVEGAMVSRREALRHGALAGLVVGLCLLGGHTTNSWMVLFAAALYAAVRVASTKAGNPGGTGRLFAGGVLLAALFAGALVAAVQVLPTIQALAESPTAAGRALRPYPEFIHEWWRVFMLPFAGAAPNLRGAGFIGVVAAALAIVGAGAWAGERARRALWAVALCCYLVFISPSIGLYDLLAAIVPTFRILSYTYHFLFPCVLALAVCAGRGYEAIVDKAPSRRMLGALAAAGLACAVFAAWFALSWKHPVTGLPADPAWLFVPSAVAALALAAVVWMRCRGTLAGTPLAVALFALLCVEMLVYDGHATEPAGPAFSPAAYYTRTPPVTYLRARAAAGERFRFWDLEVRRGEGRRLVKLHQWMIDGLEEASITSKIPRARYAAYAALLGEQLTLDRDAQEVRAAEGRVAAEIVLDAEGRGAARLLQMLNVRFILTDLMLGGGGYRPVSAHDSVVLYETDEALPRAYMTPAVVFAADGAAALEAITARGFDPRRATVIEGGRPDPGAGGAALIRSYRHGEVRIATAAPRGGVLVLLDPYDADWHAEVAGRPAAVLRANYIFRAVEIPAGESEVVFTHRPRLFRLGLVLSPLFAAALLLAFFLARRPPAGRVGGGKPDAHDP